jgi:transposase InsO family protein
MSFLYLTFVRIIQLLRLLRSENVAADLVDENIQVQFLLRDRDAQYVAGFDEVFRAEGAQILRTPFRTPNANAFAERFVRTVRTECLDRLLIVNARHLEQILRSYMAHYNGHRPHQGIAQKIPSPRASHVASLASRAAGVYPHRRRLRTRSPSRPTWWPHP